MGFSEATISQTLTGADVDRLIAKTGKLSEKALRRLQAIKREQKAYIAHGKLIIQAMDDEREPRDAPGPVKESLILF
jgi:hypothetical protein